MEDGYLIVATRHCGAPANNNGCDKDYLFVSLFAQNKFRGEKTPLKFRSNADIQGENRQKTATSLHTPHSSGQAPILPDQTSPDRQKLDRRGRQ
ncbi:hypothetical protein [Pseudomonas saxonica]|uniref:Uncharacterized protein n=1 Tax=Pseudomonas saxonica TaxID=2600598 RepID=A0ABY3GIK4_9PSED|nr:hypothetical protein [Pseudomonas saxonica]TWR88539.1 hypothetical protein FJD38_14080 [Pseudomonas saxonica]WRQ77190.1 hypothetical protein VQY67_11660 [Pseudomonas saxonica]